MVMVICSDKVLSN